MPTPAHTYSHPLDAGACNLLTVVQLKALQPTAVLQVLQGHVGDEEAVVQFQNPQSLVATGAVAQVQDSIICDELTVGQTLERKRTRLQDLLIPRLMASEKQGSWPVQYPRATVYEQEGQTQSLGALHPRVCYRAGQWFLSPF